MSQNNYTSDINYHNLKNIGKWFLILFTILFAIQWCCVHFQIEEIKEQNRQKLDTLIGLDSTNELKFSKTNDGGYIIEPSEITNLNKKVNELSKEIYSETHRAESIIDKDLDRLNLYMAIGIGFMTLLGIFVPILVNIISVQDLKEKQNSMKAEVDSIKPELVKIETLKESADKIFPKISTLSLQISINRFFNMNANYLQDYAISGNFFRYKNLLTIIKSELIKCKNDKLHKIYEDDSLKDTIIDFSKILFDERFIFSSYITNPEITEKFIELSSILKILSNSTDINEETNYDNVILKMEELINLF